MKQMGLIDRVVESLGLDSALTTSKWIPADAILLICDEDSKPPQGSFSYARHLSHEKALKENW